jgi:hypothetical protein
VFVGEEKVGSASSRFSRIIKLFPHYATQLETGVMLVCILRLSAKEIIFILE